MYSHLESDIYHLKSCICLTAESRPLTASYAAAQPLALLQNHSLLSLRPPRLCGSTAFVFCLYSVLSTRHSVLFLAPRSRVPAALAQSAKAAAMTEPTASLGGSSRASRMAMALFQRLLPSFPPVIAAANLTFTPYLNLP